MFLQVVQNEFDGFERLFDRFLHETGPSVEWEKIEQLPGQAVSIYMYIYMYT